MPFKKGNIITEETRKLISNKLKGRKMYEMTDEIRHKISEGHKGIKPSIKARNKMRIAKLGKKASDETRKKLSLLSKGRIMNEKTRMAISVSKIGIPRSEEAKKKISISSMGRVSPRKGKHHTEEAKNKLKIAHTGKKHSEEHKRKISESGKGRKLSQEHINILSKYRKGKTWEDISGKEKADKIIEKIRKARFNQKKVFETKIEIKIQNFLKELGIDFEKHKYLSGIYPPFECDIYIPSTKTIIEADGDYWHGNKELFKEKVIPPFIKKRAGMDKYRNYQILKQGYILIRLWESDINKMNIEDFKNILIKKEVKEKDGKRIYKYN